MSIKNPVAVISLNRVCIKESPEAVISLDRVCVKESPVTVISLDRVYVKKILVAVISVMHALIMGWSRSRKRLQLSCTQPGFASRFGH